MENPKAKPISKANLEVLLQLIEGKSILTTKATNATNNKLKEEAWQGITREFSAIVGETRRPEQLKLKWENMKKAARKRAAAIRQNNLKTGGGKSYIPPDDILDRVASMLGATCTGFSVEFGGDAADVPDSSLLSLPSLLLESQSNEGLGVGDGTDDVSNGGNGNTEYTPRAMLFNTPHNTQNKRRKLADELLQAQVDKEIALAGYFRAKADKTEAETEKIKIETEKIKTEVEILKNNL